MSSYIVRAQKFIKSIYPYISLCQKYVDFSEEIQNWKSCNRRRNVQISGGYSRIVFITSDYVIKIDRPDSRDNTFGTCETELELYNRVKDTQWGYLFAEITKYEYEDMTFYIMPRIKGIYRMSGDAEEYMTPEEREVIWTYRIYDRHNGNYGWKNHHIVFIDYAACG